MFSFSNSLMEIVIINLYSYVFLLLNHLSKFQNTSIFILPVGSTSMKVEVLFVWPISKFFFVLV